MQKIKRIIKNNIKLVIGIIIGLVIAGTIGVYAATVLASKDVIYSNTTSGLSATTVQGAIDELYKKAKENGTKCPEGYKCIKSNILEAYTYNSSTCVTGEESTCVKTTCYENKAAGSCPPGTIVIYFVNKTTLKYFHVLHDDGETITMQQRENTVYSTAWYANGVNLYGPTTILPVLENATTGWTNVKDQTYTMGTTTFLTNKYTGCDNTLSCKKNEYTLGSRTAKARMITLQEAAALGCTKSEKSCPNWMNNYLYNSTSNGGTVNDDTTANGAEHNYGYWTMSAYSSGYYNDDGNAWRVEYYGYVGSSFIGSSNTRNGARAVVVVSK